MNEQDAFELAYKNGYEKGKAEVLADIHREIELALDSNYKARKERIITVEMATDDAFIEYINGKIAALRGIDDFLVEIKKKFTECGE